MWRWQWWWRWRRWWCLCGFFLLRNCRTIERWTAPLHTFVDGTYAVSLLLLLFRMLSTNLRSLFIMRVPCAPTSYFHNANCVGPDTYNYTVEYSLRLYANSTWTAKRECCTALNAGAYKCYTNGTRDHLAMCNMRVWGWLDECEEENCQLETKLPAKYI